MNSEANIFDVFCKEILEENEYFDEIYNKVSIKNAEKTLHKGLNDLSNEVLTEVEFQDAMRFCELLSKSTSAKARNKALKTMSLLYDFYCENELYLAYMEAVLVSLGNFPSLNIIKENVTSSNFEVELQKIVKQTYQQTPFEGAYFTDAQFSLFNKLLQNNHYSFSGPTSFGKTFIMQSFIEKITSDNSGNVVILVPTKALIGQIALSLKSKITNENYVVFSFPKIPAIYKNKGKKFIFIFTPERWVSYVLNKENPPIAYMFVDEAHKIVSKNDSRAPLYYHAVFLAERKSVKLFFASPNIPNAEIFLKLFDKSIEESYQVKEDSVTQNRFFIDYVEKYISYFDEKEYKLTFIDEEPLEMIRRIGSNEQNIIYSNSIASCTDYAMAFSDLLPEKSNDRINNAINIIQETIHKDYFLIDCLKKGVAFHFGRLPQTVRKLVELLFIDGEIEYMFCTSTLLEGINLPAKNIFVFSNAKGHLKFDDVDFWNLAGRAGRLMKELSGNVFCVRDEVHKYKWNAPSDLDILKATEVKDIESVLLSDSRSIYTKIQKSIANQDYSEPYYKKEIWKHYGNIAVSHKVTGVSSILLENLHTKQKESTDLLNKIKNENTVLDEILLKSSRINERYQNSILKTITKADVFPEIITRESCSIVLHKMYDIYRWDLEESGGQNPLVKSRNVISYLEIIMKRWMSGNPLSEMIRSSIVFHDKFKRNLFIKGMSTPFSINNSYHINHVINELMADIEHKLKFEIKNYLQNYYLLLVQKLGEEDAGLNWANFIEFGTSDVKIIELQELGFERTTAQLLIQRYMEYFIFENSRLIQIHADKLLKAFDQELFPLEYDEILNIILDLKS